MTDHNMNDDLAWTAFRYISGELSAEDATAFEGRLADDQSSRDAVVRAVQLTSAVASAIPEPTTAPKSTKRAPARASRLLAPTMLCSLVVVLLLQSWFASSKPERDASAPSETDEFASDDGATEAGRLVSLWVSNDDENGLRAERLESAPVAADEAFASEWELADDRDAALVVPEWMIAALSRGQIDNEFEIENRQETN